MLKTVKAKLRLWATCENRWKRN